MVRHFQKFAPDRIVLATHQREELDRWLHKAIAEPLARRSGAMTLFVPRAGRGFVSLNDGSVALKKIRDPDPQPALEKALLLARGLGCSTGEFRLVHVGPRRTAPVLDPPSGQGWSYDLVETRGDVVNEILKTGQDWNPDLMVLATQGHLDFLDALCGSTTEQVLHGARCPILAVPAIAAPPCAQRMI